MKRVETVVNKHSQPISIHGGVILAPAGVEGSRRNHVLLSDADIRRHVPHRLALLGNAMDVKDEAPAAPVEAKPEAAAAPVLEEQPKNRRGEKS